MLSKQTRAGYQHTIHKINVAVGIIIERANNDIRMLHRHPVEQMDKGITDDRPLNLIMSAQYINHLGKNGWQGICLAGLDLLFRKREHILVVTNQKAENHICVNQRHETPPSFSTAAF